MCSIVAYPLTGALSDRTRSRFGRRRPWIAGGTLLFAVGLVLLGLQTGIVGIGICWCIAIIGFCVLGAALTATISDQVPVEQRGYVSGWISAPQAVGVILGIALLLVLGTQMVAGYLALAVLLLILVIPFLLTADPIPDGPRLERITVGALLESLWISPRKHPDFGWTMLSRVLVNLGNAFSTSLLFYFLLFGLGDADAETDLLLFTIVYTVFVVAASLVLGRLSDRTGRRRIFVVAASASQALAALLLAIWPSLPMGFIAAALIGLGYGCFMSVDQALATQVLPDPTSHGKDLGIMNIAQAVPQAIAPLIGAVLVAWLGGFAGLYLVSAACAVAGAFAVTRVRGVR
ncbi:MAG TPA: MFS transporter [Plantibacter sp.]|uniref:MFS transporter n=1 Tax=unclassified Plantibacter TaxID=2624265 RepID=UPI002C5AD149|nr:MFS transporter [Plantibacter sp.]